MRHILSTITLALCIALAPAAARAVPPELGSDQILLKTKAFSMQNAEILVDNKPGSDPMMAARKLLMLQPDNLEVLSWMAQHQQPNASDSFYLDILQFTPDPGALFGLGQKLSDEGYTDLATPYLKAAADTAKSFHGHGAAGVNAYYGGQFSDCVQYLDHTLKLATAATSDGLRSEAMRRAGRCHAERGQMDEAAALFASPLHAGRDNEWDVALFQAKVFSPCKGRAENHLRSAQKAFERGRRFEAYSDALRAQKCEPDNIQVLDWLIRIEAEEPKLARWQKVHEVKRDDARSGGQTTAQRRALLQPASVDQMLTKGEADIAANVTHDIVRAAYLASRVLLMEPDNARARLLRARALNNLQIDDLRPLAWDDATRALKANPNLAVAHHVRGVLLREYNAHAEAAVEYDKAIAIDSKDTRFYVNRSASLRQLRLFDRALSDINVVLAARPDDADALLSRGMMHEGLKNYDAALADFDRVYAAQTSERNRVTARTLAIRIFDQTGRSAEGDRRHRDLIASKLNINDVAYLKQRNPAMVTVWRGELKAEEDAKVAREASEQYSRIAGKFDYVQTCAKELNDYVTKFRESNGSQVYQGYVERQIGYCLRVAREVDIEAKSMLENYRNRLRTLSQQDQAYVAHAYDLNKKYMSHFLDVRRNFGFSSD